MLSKRERMGYKGINRSEAGAWKHTGTGMYLKENREKISRPFGVALAASGLMKGERRDWVKLFQFVMGQTRAYGQMFCYSPISFMKSLRPELGEAVQDLRQNSDWEIPAWVGNPWFYNSPYNYLHALHVSEEDPTQVAFAENVDKLIAGKYTRCKPGRYLTRFFSDILTEDQIRSTVEKFAARMLDGDLAYVENTDPEGWVDIYKRGPASCMQGEDCVKVYAYPDNGLRLAYLTQGEEIIARCIVRDDKKHFIRIYPANGDDSRVYTMMVRKLEEAGYEEHRDLDGVKLRAIDCGDTEYVMPYIDGSTQGVDLSHNGGYFTVSRRGEHEANNTCGTIRLEPEAQCEDCGDGVNEEDVTYVERDERTVCSDCLSRNYVEAIGRRGWGDWSQTSDTVYCETDGQHYVTDDASSNDVFECEDSGKYYKMDDLCQTKEGLFCTDLCVALDEEDSDGNTMAHKDHAVTTHDGRTIHEDDVIEHSGLDYHKDDDLPEEDDENAVRVPYTGTQPGDVDVDTLPLPLDDSEPTGVNG